MEKTIMKLCVLFGIVLNIYTVKPRVGLACQIGPGDLVMGGPHYRAFGQNPKAQPQTLI